MPTGVLFIVCLSVSVRVSLYVRATSFEVSTRIYSSLILFYVIDISSETAPIAEKFAIFVTVDCACSGPEKFAIFVTVDCACSGLNAGSLYACILVVSTCITFVV